MNIPTLSHGMRTGHWSPCGLAVALFLLWPQLTSAQTPARVRPTAPIPPLRGAGPVAVGVADIMGLHGEAYYNRGGEAGAEPLRIVQVPLARDEISTRAGTVDLVMQRATYVQLAPNSLISLLAPDSIYLARGEVVIQSAPGTAGNLGYVVTPCGRSQLRVKNARIRVDGNATVIDVLDGTARLGNILTGTTNVGPGQVARCVKGEPLSPAQSQLAAPQWLKSPDLYLTGESPRDVQLTWQAVSSAKSYRLDLFRLDSSGTPRWHKSQDLSANSTSLELSGLEVGSYHASLFAVDGLGGLGQASTPLRFFVARVVGLQATGGVQLPLGTPPVVRLPSGTSASYLIDGEAPTSAALKPGSHRLKVMVAGLSAEVLVQVTDTTVVTASQHDPFVAPEPPSVAPVAPPPPIGPTGPALAESPPPNPSPALPSLPILPPPSRDPDEILLGGVGESPLDGLRSPWAKTTVGGRIEASALGLLRFSLGGRFVLRGGFGVDAWASVLRASMLGAPGNESPAGLGNLNVAVRTPAWRTRRLALQGLLSGVLPIGTSFIDRSVEVDSFHSPDGARLQDLLPRGGGWRLEPAVLLGLRLGQAHLITTQAATLRLSAPSAIGYAGTLALHIDVLSLVRFFSFAAWHVGYLGVPIEPDSSLPDVGAAVGGGFELRPLTRPSGTLRLVLAARAGIGQPGAAVYGRGTFGLQLGYLFR